MTIILKSVELSNIRSHKHTKFEPAEIGLTSISGPNGAGKSSLVDAIPWALFGTKPQGVSKVISILRSGAELPKDKCYVRLELQVDERDIKIERRMGKGGSVECEVYEKLLKSDGSIDWTTVAGPAVSHAEPYIRKLIRMGEKGFLAAILVQQKQVDQLISATPRERGAVIEKLTGISSVTAAVTESRQEYNSLRKMASFSSVDEVQLQKFKDENALMQEDLHEKTARYNKLVSEEKQLKQKGVELKKAVEEENRKAEEAQEAKQTIAGLKATITAQEKSLERLLQEKAQKKKRLSSLGSKSQREELTSKNEKLEEERAATEEQQYKLKTLLLDLEEHAERYKNLIELSSVKKIEDVELKEKALQKKIEKNQLELEELIAKQNKLKASIESLAQAQAVLNEGEGSCPTCLQKVKDSTVVIASLAKEEAAEKEELKKCEEKEKTLLAQKAKDEISLEKYLMLKEALEKLPLTLKEQETHTSELKKLQAQHKTTITEQKALSRLLHEAQREEEMKVEYENILTRAQDVSDEIEAAKKKIHQLENSGLQSLTPAALNKLRKEYDEVRNEYLTLTTTLADEKGEIKLLHEKHRNLEEKITHEEKAIAKHKELLKSVEVASNSTQLLEEFRANRIENSVPLIESYASDLLNRFTEGKFTRLKLDGKFNASVILNDGTERAIGLLSGGELSAASMALRLAVSLMLNGGSSQSLIILDEVLVSQDSTRAELILNTIKDICRGQVVLIAHNEFADQVADKLVPLG